MESPITMGEAGDNNVCKDKSKHTDDGICVNGDISSDDEPMDVCIDSKAPEVNSNSIESLKNCEKVPENKVPTEDKEENDDEHDEPMEVEETTETAAIDDKIDAVKTVDLDNNQNDTDSNHDGGDVSTTNGNLNGSIEEDTPSAANNEQSAEEEEEEAKDDCVEINDSGDVVLVENDNSEPRENGDVVCISPEVQEVISVSDKDALANSSADAINLVSPSKKKQPKKIGEKTSEIAPRRSTRNLNKQRSYVEKDDLEETDDVLLADSDTEPDPDNDVLEVTPEDPLADPLASNDKENRSKKIKPIIITTTRPTSTIVVSDTKRLVEIAANSKTTNSSGKKEPTLVIIDTNSILSGRGPVPVTHKNSSSSSSSSAAAATTAAASAPSAPTPTPTIQASFSMMPVALPAQGVYPPNMRATITPIPMSSHQVHKSLPIVSPVTVTVPTPTAPILPTLTDDMYVVEAPSFIVPYVYEKPPLKPFKAFIHQMEKDIIEQKKKKEAAEKEKAKKKEEEDGDDNDDDDDDDDDDEKDSDETKDESKKETSDDDKAAEANKKKKNDVNVISKTENNSSMETIDLDKLTDTEKVADLNKPKSSSYFDNALGQFFINIGYGLVQEFVQTDLLKQQKRKQNREGGATPDVKLAISSLIKNLEYSKENNEPYKMEQKRCDYCSFKTESALVLAHHLETPHMRTYVYKCNFCPLEVRSPHDILFHMEAEHNMRGRLERAPAFHQCPNCPFEDNQKGKLSRHLVNCMKKFRPERNLEPPMDWEPPAKIPRVPRVKQQGLTATAAAYQAMAQVKGNYQLFSKLQQAAVPQQFPRSRGRPSLVGKVNTMRPQPPIIRTNMMYRPGTSGSVLVPTTYQFGGNQIFQVVGSQSDLGGAGSRLSMSASSAAAPVALVPNLTTAQSTVTIQNSSGTKSNSSKVVQQPSISITPLPRQPASSSTTITKTSSSTAGAPGAGGGGGTGGSGATAGGTDSNAKGTFVICEICDGYIKDLEQLRNHMQWIHKVKIHPKMIYNRPPLNCQKCQFRFFTDQGLERHLLGSHGLVTSSMQEAANKSKDAGRCPVCGRVYQWKLLNHVARDHNMTLKPAHLSYKCTVCTATFGMYKQFENHVYSAHSVVAKRVMEKKSPTTSSTSSTSGTSVTVSSRSSSGGGSSGSGDSLLKPLKINDEITIIPQPAKSSKTATAANSNSISDRGK